MVRGLREILSLCTDPKGFTRRVNEELRRLWEASKSQDPGLAQKIEGIDAKISNIRRAIEDGLADASWANARLRELFAERKTLTESPAALGQSPQIDIQTALDYRRQTERVFSQGESAERKRLLRTWVQEIKLAPESLQVDISYRIPSLL